ncbi:hypothetical protein QOT17_022304 [Balamuthia mandrillaris]
MKRKRSFGTALQERDENVVAPREQRNPYEHEYRHYRSRKVIKNDMNAIYSNSVLLFSFPLPIFLTFLFLFLLSLSLTLEKTMAVLMGAKGKDKGKEVVGKENAELRQSELDVESGHLERSTCHTCQKLQDCFCCSFCQYASCLCCGRRCVACSKLYCGFCSTTNYDQKEERTMCLDCDEADKQKRRVPVQTQGSSTSSSSHSSISSYFLRP